jgi:hypothetical protein
MPMSWNMAAAYNDDFPAFKDPGFQRGNLCSSCSDRAGRERSGLA